MSEPRALVEHFFRHEFGRLVAVLTRSLGVRRLALVEDVAGAALVLALETWSRRGVPEDPAVAFTAPPATWRSTRCGGSEPTPRRCCEAEKRRTMPAARMSQCRDFIGEQTQGNRVKDCGTHLSSCPQP